MKQSTPAKLQLEARHFENFSSRDVLKFAIRLGWQRLKLRIHTKAKDIVDELVSKPFGRLFVKFYLLRDKVNAFAFEKGWVKKKKDSFEVEFDRKTENCFKIFMDRLKTDCEKRDKGNTSFYAIQNDRPCFTALGAWAHRDYINKREFDIDSYPYSRSFTGHSIPVHVIQNNMKDFQKYMRDIFLRSMDIDENFTVKCSEAFFSKSLLNLYSFFSAYPMFQNKEMDFWMEKFMLSFMRLVHLEQRKLDVNEPHIRELKTKWEQEVVDDFGLAITFIGITQYAAFYKGLPFSVKKRVPNFHARNSYERKDVYRRPSDQFKMRTR